MRSFLAVCLIGSLLPANPARAQQPQPQAAPREAQPEQPTERSQVPANEALRAEKLPISIERIQRKLAQAPRSSANPLSLRLEYYIEVYGKAPRLDLFTDFDLEHGPVPYGAPTHAEFLQLLTPQEFRAPAADFPALIAWLAQQLAKKSTGTNKK